MSGGKASASTDEFGDRDIDDDELVKASFRDQGFDHIDNYANPTENITRNNTVKNTSSKDNSRPKPIAQRKDEVEQEARRLENGNWACNHPCKDKQACRHLCCKEGMAKPPKKTVTKCVPSIDTGLQSVAKVSADQEKKTQTKLQLTASKRKGETAIEELDLSQQEKRRKADYAINGPRDYRDLHRLHKSIQQREPPSTISSVMHQKPAYCYGKGDNPSLSFLDIDSHSARPGSISSDYGDVQFEDLTGDLHQLGPSITQPTVSKNRDDTDLSIGCVALERLSDTFGDDESLFEDAMVGVADSEELRATGHGSQDRMQAPHDSMNDDYDFGLRFESLVNVDAATLVNKELSTSLLGSATSSIVNIPSGPPEKNYSLFFSDKSSPGLNNDSTGPEPVCEYDAPRELKQANDGLTLLARTSKGNVSHSQPENGTHNAPISHQVSENVEPEEEIKEEPLPEAYKDLEPWIYKEFGDIVELVD